MQLQVTFRHVEPSEAVKDYAREKVSKLTKYLDGPVEAQVTLSVEKHRHEADVLLMASGLKIHGREVTGDLFSAIDLVVDKLERQLKRYRDKLKKIGRNHRRIQQEVAHHVVGPETPLESTPRIIKSDRLVAKPMDVDEAALQLELSDDEFLVFINARTEAVNVIYKRKDGTFGWIEPQS